MVLEPGCQLAGQTTPFLSACWKALMTLRVSSALRPTCSSFMVMDRIFPLPSITKSPLRVAPQSPSSGSSTNTPQSLAMVLVMSETRGISMGPSPPSFRSAFLQAKWEKCESTDTASTSVLNSLIQSQSTSEILDLRSIGGDFCGTYISEVKGIEQQDNEFSSIIAQTDLLEREIRHHCLGCEIGCLLAGHQTE